MTPQYNSIIFIFDDLELHFIIFSYICTFNILNSKIYFKNRIKTFKGKYDEISGVTGIAKEKRRLTVQKPQNILTNDAGGSIINTKDVPRIPQVPSSTITRKIEAGQYSTKISHQHYQKHVMGTPKYNEYLSTREKNGDNPQSILTITEKEAQEIIKSKAGTGMVRVTRKGEPTPKEDITCEKVIGKYYAKGEYHDTKKATIHYGKKSAHIVPIRGIIMINLWQYQDTKK